MYEVKLEFNDIVVLLEALENYKATQKRWVTTMADYDLQAGRDLAEQRVVQSTALFDRLTGALREKKTNV